jgi:hypothetical protein
VSRRVRDRGLRLRQTLVGSGGSRFRLKSQKIQSKFPRDYGSARPRGRSSQTSAWLAGAAEEPAWVAGAEALRPDRQRRAYLKVGASEAILPVLVELLRGYLHASDARDAKDASETEKGGFEPPVRV